MENYSKRETSCLNLPYQWHETRSALCALKWMQTSFSKLMHPKPLQNLKWPNVTLNNKLTTTSRNGCNMTRNKPKPYHAVNTISFYKKLNK